MKNFDIRRFCAVARWDLTINRAFYNKMAMVIAACSILPVLFYHAIENLERVSDADGVGKPYSSFLMDLELISVFISVFSGIALTVVLGFMFHNLRNRQGRIAELTLPASNFERFLWHALVVLVGADVWFLMSVGLAEILNAILVAVTFNFGDYEYVSLTAMVCDNFYKTLPTAMVFDESFHLGAYVAIILSSLLSISVYPLINAWKYRHNIAYTILFYILAWLMLIMLITACAAFAAVCLWDAADFLYIISFFEDVPSWSLVLVLDVFLAGLLLLMWRSTYRLYCRAQITTRRNP
ncbi:MAG: hypothetical protein J6R11_06705 [Bacteroidaceae bacterium]|nr:hypothetical protein [Bacteroidaceae bacterium]